MNAVKGVLISGIWLFVSLAATGCAPAVIEPNTADWPAEYAGRKLYTTPNAWIYASSDAAAGEADRLAIEVMNGFEEITEHKVPRILIIMSDKKDPLPGDGKAIFSSSDICTGGYPPNSQPNNPDDQERIENNWQQLQEKSKQIGVPAEMVLTSMPMILNQEQFAMATGLTADATQSFNVCLLIPTESLMGDFVFRSMWGLVKSDQIGPLAKGLIVMSSPLVYSIGCDAAKIVKKRTLFEAYLRLYPKWSDENKKDLVRAYVKTIAGSNPIFN